MELAEQDALNSQELEEASVEAQALKEKLAESKQEVQQLSHECNHLQEQNRVLQEEDKGHRAATEAEGQKKIIAEVHKKTLQDGDRMSAESGPQGPWNGCSLLLLSVLSL